MYMKIHVFLILVVYFYVSRIFSVREPVFPLLLNAEGNERYVM